MWEAFLKPRADHPGTVLGLSQDRGPSDATGREEYSGFIRSGFEDHFSLIGTEAPRLRAGNPDLKRPLVTGPNSSGQNPRRLSSDPSNYPKIFHPRL